MRPVVAALLCLVAAFAGAQSREFSGGRLAGPPTLDGKVDADEYRDAIRFEGLVDASTGADTPEGGSFFLGYDARFVYFAARLVDRQPGSIQATEFRTNVSLRGNDTVTLQLDPFDTLAAFSRFTINARGATNLDIAGGRAAKREWLGDFAAKGRVTAQGWEVEARIPWSVMRLPGKGAHDLRFNVFRSHRRLNRDYAWAFIGNGLVQNFGRWKTVEFPAPPEPVLQLLPYAYGGLDGKRGVVANSGLDLRYPLTRDLDLVGTLNPDFRNVERGILSLDFSYFERLADETRPFFLEGGQYFNGGDSPIFASQRIGNFDGGAKVFGKLDPQTDVGALVTGDVGNEDAVVARIRRQIDPRTSWSAHYAGGGQDGRRNDALNAGYARGVGSWSFRGQVAGTQDDAVGEGHSASATAVYDRDRAFVFGQYRETSAKFLPRLGFAPRTDLRGFDFFAGETWLYPRGRFLQYGIQGGATYQRSYGLDKPFHEGASLYPGVTWKDGTRLNTSLEWNRYFGGSDDQSYGFSLTRPTGDPYRHWTVAYSSGTIASAPYRNLNANFAYRPLPTLQLNGNYQKTTVRGGTFDQTIFSANYDLDQYHSVGGRFVTGPGISNYYASFRQAGNRGTEYYLILGDPNAARFRPSLILKAVFPVSVRG